MEIVGHLQNYEWGKYGNDSLVARIHSSNVDIKIDEQTPYAELWMGVHNNGEAHLKDSMEPLSEFLQKNTKLLGGLNAVQCLPFLFKVLSVNKALSVQVHPNKNQALDLFKRMPSVYKDGNHKPEMAIALTEFEVMSGFRPTEEIKTFMREVPELEMLITKELMTNFLSGNKEECMKIILRNWLTKKEEEMLPIIKHFLERLEGEGEDVKNRYLFPIIKRLNEWYPNDVGVFMPFFLNYFTLEPGECMFISAGVPHAYIRGDCVECMSCSDNVVRCGLTPKLKDVDVLLEIIDLKSYTVEQLKLKGVPTSPGNAAAFNPPIEEFGLLRVTIETGETFKTPAYDACSIFIVLSGEGEIVTDNGKKALKFGSIFFLTPHMTFLIKCTKGGQLVLYLAYGVK